MNYKITNGSVSYGAETILEEINFEVKGKQKVAIVGRNGCGKTTLLRDIVRNISNGIKVLGFKGKTVGVVDERGEIAAMYKGIPQNDVGIRTDVIDNMPKPEAMRILVRSMAPNVIVWVASGVTVSRMMILVLRV